MKLKTILLSFTLSVLISANSSATEFFFGNYDIFLKNSFGASLTSSQKLEFGKFQAGFVPTSNNTDFWAANWISGLANSYNPTDPELSALINIPNNSVYAAGDQLYIWTYDVKSGASDKQWALFKDSSWSMTTVVELDFTTKFFDFTSSSTAVVGGLNFVGKTASTALVSSIPEPSTWAAIFGFAAIGFAFWKRSKK